MGRAIEPEASELMVMEVVDGCEEGLMTTMLIDASPA